MNPIIAPAAAAITAALVFYTLGVFGERRAGMLEKRHLALFWLGLACDTTGTALMSAVARSLPARGASPLHAVTGMLAIVLMLFHAVWAAVVVIRGSERSRRSFHGLSICVWLVWLVPYCMGLLIGMGA